MTVNFVWIYSNSKSFQAHDVAEAHPNIIRINSQAGTFAVPEGSRCRLHSHHSKQLRLYVSWKVQELNQRQIRIFRDVVTVVLVHADWVELKLLGLESHSCTSWSVDAILAPGINRKSQYARPSYLLELNPQFSTDCWTKAGGGPPCIFQTVLELYHGE